MKNLFLLFTLSILITGCGGSKATVNDLADSNPIMTSIDLTAIDEDRVPVTINPGRFTTEMVTYRLPRVVQGTYDVSDFGSFVDDIKAYDYEGNEMAINKLDNNSWTIADATKLDKIGYLVNDTFDIEGGDQQVPFSPAGTNIEEDNFVLNLHGFIGYFDSLKSGNYQLEITSPKDFKRTAALQNVSSRDSEDGTKTITTYSAPRYFDITDNPMMFGDLDVEEFMVGDIKIVLSIYSPNKVHSAASLKETIFEMMKGQKAYLGDVDSTPRYDIYLYLTDGRDDGPKGFGALEHHTSTIVVLSENAAKEALEESMVDIVSHEFFHIVTPLSVHSEDVHYFDYAEPTFSKHLWMYEGVTEYFAQHFQVYEDLVEPSKFYDTVLQKINVSMRLDDAMSFTKMSENILEEPYASNYYNVYQKGALIGMCIDILMREESNGQRSMLSLMKELSNKYGVNKPFEDDKLISEITSMTYPSVGEFLKSHVEGETPIDYNKYFKKVGLKLAPSKIETNYIRGGEGFIFRADREKGQILFTEGVKLNTFWAEQGILPDDILNEVDGVVIAMQNAQSVLGKMYQWKPGQDVELKLTRNGEEVMVKTTLEKTYTTSNTLVQDETASEAQINTRKAWLGM